MNRRLLSILALICTAMGLGELSAQKYLYDVSICAIFRDEAPWLKEWIEFHQIVGVEHFYLLNNLSKDHYLEVLAPYIERGVVELIDWPYESSEGLVAWNNVQCAGYEHVAKKSSGETRWLAFLDTDEYLFPVRTADLPSFLRQYRNVGGVCVNWVMYGTSGVDAVEANELMTERLILRAPLTHPEHQHVKSIVRPERVARIINPHFCLFYPGWKQVDTLKHPFTGPWCTPVFTEARINHYWSGDKKRFFMKKLARQESWSQTLQGALEKESLLNAEEDRSIFRFGRLLRKAMGLSAPPSESERTLKRKK